MASSARAHTHRPKGKREHSLARRPAATAVAGVVAWSPKSVQRPARKAGDEVSQPDGRPRPKPRRYAIMPIPSFIIAP